MNRGSMKTALIVALIIGVVLQTGKLWFEGSSGHNFFSSFYNTSAQTRYERSRIEPSTVIVNLGNTKYLKAGLEAQSEIKAISDRHLENFIDNGVFLSEQPLSWQTLLDQKSVIYEYPIVIDTAAFAASFGKAGGDFRSKMRGFDTIIIRPSRISSESIMLYAVNQEDGISYVFEGEKGVSEPLSNEINGMLRLQQASDGDLSYISSAQSRLNFFDKNVFLPEWQGYNFVYTKAHVYNPIEDSYGLEKSAQMFFDNPVGVLSAVDSAGMPFVSDRESVVKYYSDIDVLEYTSYRDTGTGQTKLDEAYSAAVSIINKDVSIENEVFFSGGHSDNGDWTLYFDYRWDGMRVFDETYEHAIEVNIKGGEVVKYRRVVKGIFGTEFTGAINENFISVLDRVLADSTEDTIGDMELGFNVTEHGTRGIDWFVKINGGWSAR